MTYYAIITDAGQALLAEAMASGVPVTLTQFAVGDGGGQPVIPDPAMAALAGETFRDSISSLTTDPAQPDALVAQLIVPKESGGYTVREVGLFTEDGTLFSVANYPDQVKPPVDSGYAIKLDLRYVLAVSDTSAITIVIPPGDYLTKEAADALYLDTALNLQEIADAGEEAQQAARYNIDAAATNHGHEIGDIAGLIDLIYPIGRALITEDSRNPAEYLRFGVWSARAGYIAAAGTMIDSNGHQTIMNPGWHSGYSQVHKDHIVQHQAVFDLDASQVDGHDHDQPVSTNNTGTRIEVSGGESSLYVGNQKTGLGGAHGHDVTGYINVGIAAVANGLSMTLPATVFYVWVRTA